MTAQPDRLAPAWTDADLPLTATQLHEHAVKMAMEAWESVQPRLPHPGFNPLAGALREQRDKDRAAFEACARERLAQTVAIIALERPLPGDRR